MGLPEIEYPTDENGWAHCLTIPRELSLKGDKLLQKPVRELASLRANERNYSCVLENEETIIEGFQGRVYEAICNFENIRGNRVGIKLRKGIEEETIFYYDLEEKKLVLDRSNSGESFATEYGTERKCPYEGSNLKLQVFVDTSSIEVFVNDGEEVFTARIFTAKDSSNISIFAHGKTDVNLKIWDLYLDEK